LSLARKRHQITVTKPFTDRACLQECRVRPCRIASMDRTITGRQKQISSLHAVRLALKQPFGARKPAASLGPLAAHQRYETQPERRSRRALRRAAVQESLMRAGQKIHARALPPHQVGGYRESL
jgi:hypothetical protein